MIQQRHEVRPVIFYTKLVPVAQDHKKNLPGPCIFSDSCNPQKFEFTAPNQILEFIF